MCDQTQRSAIVLCRRVIALAIRMTLVTNDKRISADSIGQKDRNSVLTVFYAVFQPIGSELSPDFLTESVGCRHRNTCRVCEIRCVSNFLLDPSPEVDAFPGELLNYCCGSSFNKIRIVFDLTDRIGPAEEFIAVVVIDDQLYLLVTVLFVNFAGVMVPACHFRSGYLYGFDRFDILSAVDVFRICLANGKTYRAAGIAVLFDISFVGCLSNERLAVFFILITGLTGSISQDHRQIIISGYRVDIVRLPDL